MSAVSRASLSRAMRARSPPALAPALAAPALVALSLAALACAAAATCVVDNTSRDFSWEVKLDKDLKANSSDSRRSAPCDRVNVTLKFILKSFFFDAGEEVFNVYSWMFLGWDDPRLAWDPAAYGGIDRSQIIPFYIWSPSVKLQNGFKVYYLGLSRSSECHVSSTGGVSCVLRAWHEVICSSKLSDWPYDTQTCRLVFGTKSKQASLSFRGSRGVSMWGAEYGPGWNIVDYEQGEVEAGKELYFELTVERQAAGLGALSVTPALALSALTLSLPLLGVGSAVRAPLATLGILAHFTVLSIIDFSVPQHNRDYPTVLKYTKWSLWITTVSLILTFILNKLTARLEAPAWVCALNGRVQGSPLRLVVRARRLHAGLAAEVSRRHETEWIDFANLCNAVFFLVIAVLYCVLYFAYIPRPPPM